MVLSYKLVLLLPLSSRSFPADESWLILNKDQVYLFPESILWKRLLCSVLPAQETDCKQPQMYQCTFFSSSNCSYLNYVQSCDVFWVGAVATHVLHGNFSLETSVVWLNIGGERIIIFPWVVFLGSWGRACIAWVWVVVYILKVFLCV